MHIALVEGQYRDAPLACTVGLLQWGATRPEDASVAIQVQPGRPGKNGTTLAHAHTHTHTTFASDLFPVIGSGRVPQAPYSVTARRKAVTNAPTPVTRAPQVHSLCPAHCLPACSMQEAENPSGSMLQQRTPHPRAHRPAPAFESMRPAWAAALPSLHPHAERRTTLLRPQAPQSVHASNNTHRASGTT